MAGSSPATARGFALGQVPTNRPSLASIEAIPAGRCDVEVPDGGVGSALATPAKGKLKLDEVSNAKAALSITDGRILRFMLLVFIGVLTRKATDSAAQVIRPVWRGPD